MSESTETICLFIQNQKPCHLPIYYCIQNLTIKLNETFSSIPSYKFVFLSINKFVEKKIVIFSHFQCLVWLFYSTTGVEWNCDGLGWEGLEVGPLYWDIYQRCSHDSVIVHIIKIAILNINFLISWKKKRKLGLIIE